MTWTYDSSQLATNEIYQVRLEIGDTDSAAPLLDDEEIERAISVEGSFWGAAARCCEIVSRTFLRKADVRIGRGGTTLQWAQAAQQFTDMAKGLRTRANAMNAPWTGGTSIAAKADLASDGDAVQPIFTKTTGNNPWVGGESNDSVTDDGQEDFR